MKKILLLSLLITALSFGAMAQTETARNQTEQKVEAQRVAYITNKLELSPQEAQSFWPVYNQYKRDEKQLKRSLRRPGSIHLMTDVEIEEYIDDMIDVEEKKVQLMRQYYLDLKKVLPVRKIANLVKAEREFTQMVVRRMNQRAQNRRRNN